MLQFSHNEVTTGNSDTTTRCNVLKNLSNRNKKIDNSDLTPFEKHTFNFNIFVNSSLFIHYFYFCFVKS